ncbi:hypothetical protein CDD83_8929 [Cordyceps sp. RAO-2017]|nr:hypothetical protein CDD83_8929 [Cordyceps sp. RAO-2017]
MGPLSLLFRSASGRTDSPADSKEAVEQREAAAARQRRELEDASEWIGRFMNDDVDVAYEKLQAGDSAFHSLGLAFASFLRCLIGLDKQTLAETAAKLDRLETRAAADAKAAQQTNPRPASPRC